MKRAALALICVILPMTSFAGSDPLRKVSKQMCNDLRPLKNPRVALLSFPYIDGKISSGSSILSERLTTYMAELKGVRVIERNLLRKVLEEQHLSETGIVDASAAKKIGNVAGVDVIITGTLNDLEDNKTELNARAIKTDTGEVVAAQRVIVERSWSDPARFADQAVTRSIPVVVDEPDEQPASNEEIEIGYPAGGRGGPRGGFRRR